MINVMPNNTQITLWIQQEIETDKEWESAYKRFETPLEEISKFKRRLKILGVDDWPRDANIVELFCGRCNGINALEELGFSSIEGVDLSVPLLSEYSGNAKLYAGDCRNIRFKSNSKDIVIVQGGLHHLPSILEDLNMVFLEVKRILTPGGRFVFVEPWQTPFLTLAHYACSISMLTSRWAKLKALQEMIEREKVTYCNWLANKSLIITLLNEHFSKEQFKISFGKIFYKGYPVV